MITYKLNTNGTYAQKIVDNVATTEWHNTEISETYLEWLEEGNTPLPADEPSEGTA
jgi:hypothetical protein